MKSIGFLLFAAGAWALHGYFSGGVFLGLALWMAIGYAAIVYDWYFDPKGIFLLERDALSLCINVLLAGTVLTFGAVSFAMIIHAVRHDLKERAPTSSR